VVYLNEWFPDPPGADAGGEFLELYNNGASAVSLNGWTIAAEGKKKFSLKNITIPAHGYLALTHAETKLSLRNSDGGLALYDARGALVDSAAFAGAAPVGKSYSRQNYTTADIEHFAFVDPTPGAANYFVRTALAVQAHRFWVPLDRPLDTPGFFAIMMGTAALIAGLIIYVIRSHEDLSQLFFGRDEGTRGEIGKGGASPGGEALW